MKFIPGAGVLGRYIPDRQMRLFMLGAISRRPHLASLSFPDIGMQRLEVLIDIDSKIEEMVSEQFVVSDDIQLLSRFASELH